MAHYVVCLHCWVIITYPISGSYQIGTVGFKNTKTDISHSIRYAKHPRHRRKCALLYK